ncbi:MAG: hypothetical protein RIM80_14925, partial [Alphaproteobacteria bacterium]
MMPIAPDASEEKTHALTVAEEDGGARLDKYLTQALSRKAEGAAPGGEAGEVLSRARVKQLIEEGRVTLVGETRPRPAADPSYRVKPGERIEVTVPPPAPARPAGQAIPLDVVYEDAELIVVM